MSKAQTTINTPTPNRHQEQVQYQSEVKTAMLGDRVIRLENLIPILAPKEREEREREIESRLFHVFIKYITSPSIGG